MKAGLIASGVGTVNARIIPLLYIIYIMAFIVPKTNMAPCRRGCRSHGYSRHFRRLMFWMALSRWLRSSRASDSGGLAASAVSASSRSP